MTHGRGGVDVDGHARRPAARHDFGHGLQCPHLVVAPLAVHKRRATGGVGGEKRLEMGEVDPAFRVHFEHEDRSAPGRSFAHAGVLHVSTDHGGIAAGPPGGEDRSVGSLRATTREHDTVRRRPEQLCHGLARVLDGVTCQMALGVDATGIAGPRRFEPRRHRPRRLRPQNRGRGVVEVVAVPQRRSHADRSRARGQPATVAQTLSPRARDES